MRPGKLNKRRVQQVFDMCRSLHVDAHSAWQVRRANHVAKALNFYRGRQYQVVIPDQALDEEAKTRNICRRIVNNAVAEILAQVPSPKIPASRSDMAAQSRAKMTEQLAQSFARNGTLDEAELRDAAIWAYTAGTAFLKTYYDLDRGRHMPNTERTGLEGDDVYQPELVQLFEGAPAVEFVSEADALPDPSATNMDELRYITHRKLRPVGELEDRIPFDWEGQPTAGRFDIGGEPSYDARVREALDSNDMPYGLGTTTREWAGNTLSELVELWMLPSGEFPYGLFVVWSGVTLLYIGPNPLDPVRLPFTLVSGPNKVPNSLYSDGILADIMGLQQTMNHLETKKHEIIDKMANPHLLVPFQAQIDENTWGNKPGQVIPYAAGFTPTKLDPADIPASLFAHSQNTFEDAKFITGYSDLASGNVQASTTGRTVAFASENAEKSRAPDIAAWRNALIDVMQQLVWVTKQFVPDGRLMQMLGPQDELEVREFYSEEFDWDNQFAPEMYSDEPKTHAARIAMAIELNGANYFGDDPASERMRRLVGGSYARKSAYDPFQSDRDRARREQLAFLRNFLDVPSVQLFDIHAIHLEEHNEWRKSAEYEQLPDHVKQEFDDHCETHELLDMQAKMAGPTGGEHENRLGPQPLPGEAGGGGANVPGEPTGENPKGPEGVGPTNSPAPPPSIAEFNSMSPSEQRSTDQR